MAVDFVAYSGMSSMGPKMAENEDYILFDDYSFDDDALFACVADGAGAKGSTFRPGAIVSHNALGNFVWAWKKDKEALRKNARVMTELFFRAANDALVAFKLGNEEERGAFASTLTLAFVERDGTMTIGHVGNTRLYLFRSGRLIQMTKDQTEGQRLVDAKKITDEQYYTSMERLSLYNGLGVVPTDELIVQTTQTKLKPNDVVVMTSDGIHYSYDTRAVVELIMQSDTVDEATKKIVDAAADLKNYLDNESVNVLWYLGPNGAAAAGRKEDADGEEDR